MARKKTTVYIEDDVLRAARVYAARKDMRDSDVFEESLRAFLGLDVLERLRQRGELDEEESLRLAYEELHRLRAGRRGAAS